VLLVALNIEAIEKITAPLERSHLIFDYTKVYTLKNEPKQYLYSIKYQVT